jgi:NADH dehydrogenase [ubiquinone] 1 alpha subcomplex assembly factor 5
VVIKENLFDRNLLRLNRKRAVKNFSQHNFLFHEVANRIAENVEFLNREFDSILEISGFDGYLSTQLKAKKIICGDVDLIFDDELLPFKDASFDLIVSNLNFHFINEIPQFLIQVKKLLKPRGVFIASFFGEENLSELAHVLYKSENEIYNGVSPRMPPTIDVKTSASLLQKAGFENPISDFAKIEVEYSDVKNLLKDLKFMGQGNILTKRSRKFFTRNFLEKISKNYYELYKTSEGAVKATFEIVTATGWNK